MAILREIVRDFRKKETPSEHIFWTAARNRRISGRKFLRQFAIPVKVEGINRFFVADFYCSEERLIVEIDGAVHDTQKDYDALRTAVMNNLGLRVIRFANTDIEEDLAGVIDEVKGMFEP